MDIFLNNTLSGKKEKFVPLKEGLVSMYNCGPTVYDFAHVGNLRSYVFADVLRRMFEYNGFRIKQIVNITDIGHLSSDADDGEDKMTKALKRENKPMTLETMREVANFYFAEFKKDLSDLNIELPEKFPFASDHIEEDIDLVKKLEEKGFTYATSDGIYFDTSKFPEYGKLGNIKNTEETQSRIGLNPEKRNHRDFAVWKFSAQGGSASGGNVSGYEAPFGNGFPGWHIECSAMSVKYLGPEFDIHTGGIDHIPVHHNNEIAQSVCAGYPYAHYWMHNAHLNMGEEKMAKSGENFITLQTLKNKNIDPLALRYVFLTTRYSSPIRFSWEALEGAGVALQKLRAKIQTKDNVETIDQNILVVNRRMFNEFINDDLDTPKALAHVWDVLRDNRLSSVDKRSQVLDFDKVLGLELDKVEELEIPENVQKLLDEREKIRADKDFIKSDELRKQIESLGFEVKDTDSGPKVTKI